MKRLRALFLIAVFMLFSTHARGASVPTNRELLDEIRDLKNIIKKQDTRIADLEKKVMRRGIEPGAREEKSDKHEEHVFHKEGIKELVEYEGFRLGAGGTFIFQGTPNANSAGQAENDRIDGSYTVDIEIEKSFDDWGLAYILMEPGQGNGLDQYLDLFSIVNFDAFDTNSNPLVTEVWYEHYLFDGQLTLTGGKLYAPNYIDNNEYANDETTQFISRMFRNADTIEFPGSDWALGGRVNIAPKALNCIELEGLWMEGDGDWDAVFDHPFIGTQVNFMPAKAFGYDEEMWGGNYRVYFWYNGTDHVRLKDEEKRKDRNYGFGLSWDQMITDVYGLFGRFGWQEPRVSALEFHWSLGGQMTGKFWGRPEDIVAVGVGQAIPGKPYGDAGNPNNSETHLETYYAFKVNEYLTISPDFQWIWRPDGVGKKNVTESGDTIFVYGARGQVGF
ncbi:MAG: carbohydrate porin [Candidatus Omnitrophota bacterium]|jgi:hypothetical protein